MQKIVIVLLAALCVCAVAHEQIDALKSRVLASAAAPSETVFMELPIPPPFPHRAAPAPLALAAISSRVTSRQDPGTVATTNMQGPPGPAGPAGPAGGAKGDKGDKGDAGPRGDRGPQGIPGDQGQQGPRGPQGERGEKGMQGLIGPKGNKGDTGDHGPTGPIGPSGPQGAQGPSGDKGEKGDQGPTGPRGAAGAAGPAGAKGEKGDRGDKGAPGAAGPKGDKGDRGETGPKGSFAITYDGNTRIITGEKGDKGDEGERGAPGAMGLTGERGEKGDKGDKGDAGVIDEQARIDMIEEIKKADAELIHRQNNRIAGLKGKISSLREALQREQQAEQKLQTRLEEVEARVSANANNINLLTNAKVSEKVKKQIKNNNKRAARRVTKSVNRAVDSDESPVEFFNVGKRRVVPEYLNCNGPCAHLRPAAISGPLHHDLDENKVLILERRREVDDGRVVADTVGGTNHVHHHHFTSDVPVHEALNTVRAHRHHRHHNSAPRGSIFDQRDADRSHLNSVVDLIHSGFKSMSRLKNAAKVIPSNTTPRHRRLASRVVEAVFDAERASNAVHAFRNPEPKYSNRSPPVDPNEIRRDNDPAGRDNLLEMDSDPDHHFSQLKRAVAQAAARVVAADIMGAKAEAAPTHFSELSSTTSARVHTPRRAMSAEQLDAMFPSQPEFAPSAEPEMITL